MFTHPATNVLTLGSTHLRAVPIHPGHYSPWTAPNSHYRSHRKALPACGSAFLLALLFLVAGGMTARSHEATNTAGQPLGWNYPLSCCSLQDCRPAKHDEVRETSQGYRLSSTGEIVGYLDKRVKQSPSGDFHVCQQGGDFDKGRVLCLFAPGRNF